MPRAIRVKSASGRGIYDVVGDPGDRLSCSCPSYAYGSAGGRACKHMRWVATADFLVSRCRAEQHATETGVCLTCLVEIVGRALALAAPKTRATPSRPKRGILDPGMKKKAPRRGGCAV